MTRKATILTIVFAAAYCHPARGQAPPATLKVELQNVIFYEVDTSDSSKFGTNPNITPSGLSCAGASFGGHLGNKTIGLGDIVAVNGQPAKGTYAASGTTLCLSPTPVPGQPIADTTAGPMVYETYEILQSDGTPVGNIMTNGLRIAAPSPPGPPAATFNSVIVGGTGAFFGARGQTGNANANQVTVGGTSSRSITEDPANRRLNGGLHAVFTLYVIPLSRPEITMTASGPAVTHSNDFSLVSASKPAAAGEILSLFATGLGPTRPGVDPGQPFPSNPLAVVNSPLEVRVNGKPAEVLGAVGLPGAVDGYQVNFRVPPDIGKGPATIQVSAAWLAGAPVNVPVQ
jgi:uncharacterized protein (TIGR03437 family)